MGQLSFLFLCSDHRRDHCWLRRAGGAYRWNCVRSLSQVRTSLYIVRVLVKKGK